MEKNSKESFDLNKIDLATDLDRANLTTLAKLTNTLSFKNHFPATSGNFSLRSAKEKNFALVSESGIDKSDLTLDNFVLMDIRTQKKVEAEVLKAKKPSDENLIHLKIYQIYSDVNCILHSHKLSTLLFADLYPDTMFIEITGLEILKAMRGVNSHLAKIRLPCFENSQDMFKLTEEIEKSISFRDHFNGLILRGHGIYVWGQTINEAKRHLEAFEYIFDYFVESAKISKTNFI